MLFRSTLLGHFRHEIGHFYWDQLIAKDPQRLEAFRALFGDERADYGQALERHYKEGAPADWAQRHISAYASSHPWEDWAETWAHYLHLRDTLDTSYVLAVIVMGSACGTQKFASAVVGGLAVAGLLLYLWITASGTRHRFDLRLRDAIENAPAKRPQGNFPREALVLRNITQNLSDFRRILVAHIEMKNLQR